MVYIHVPVVVFVILVPTIGRGRNTLTAVAVVLEA